MNVSLNVFYVAHHILCIVFFRSFDARFVAPLCGGVAVLGRFRYVDCHVFCVTCSVSRATCINNIIIMCCICYFDMLYMLF